MKQGYARRSDGVDSLVVVRKRGMYPVAVGRAQREAISWEIVHTNLAYQHFGKEFQSTILYLDLAFLQKEK